MAGLMLATCDVESEACRDEVLRMHRVKGFRVYCTVLRNYIYLLYKPKEILNIVFVL